MTNPATLHVTYNSVVKSNRPIWGAVGAWTESFDDTISLPADASEKDIDEAVAEFITIHSEQMKRRLAAPEGFERSWGFDPRRAFIRVQGSYLRQADRPALSEPMTATGAPKSRCYEWRGGRVYRL